MAFLRTHHEILIEIKYTVLVLEPLSVDLLKN